MTAINVAIPSINQSINQSIKRFLYGLTSGTTARSTGDSQYVQRVVRKRLPEQMCLEEATKINMANDSAAVMSSGKSFHISFSLDVRNSIINIIHLGYYKSNYNPFLLPYTRFW